MEGAEHDRCAEAARLRRELDLARRLQAAIVSAIFSGFLVVDRKGRVMELNPLGGKILGVTPQEAIGRPVTALVRSRPGISAALETGESWSDRKFLVETSQGPRRLMTTAVPVKAADGSVLAVRAGGAPRRPGPLGGQRDARRSGARHRPHHVLRQAS